LVLKVGTEGEFLNSKIGYEMFILALLVLTRLLVVVLPVCFWVVVIPVADFNSGQASHLTNTISNHHRDTVSDTDLYVVNFATESLCLRDTS